MVAISKKIIQFYELMADDIQQICNPLKGVGIHLFSYRKTFADGSRINVSNNPNWIHDYYALNLYRSSLFEHSIESYSSGFSLWPRSSPLAVFSHGRDYYNSDNGITFTKKHADCCEFFLFGADKKNEQIINFYINHLDLLKNFTDYFLEQSKILMRSAMKNLISIKLTPIHPNEIKNIYTHQDKMASINKLILSTAKSNFYSLLSHREKSCINGIIAGKSAKMIARELNLSHRTIEYYIENIKKKTGCNTKYALLKEFSKG